MVITAPTFAAETYLLTVVLALIFATHAAADRVSDDPLLNCEPVAPLATHSKSTPAMVNLSVATTAVNVAVAEAATPEAEMGKARKVAVGGALKKLERAQRLAITFEANGMLETAFEAYKTLVETEAGLGESMEIAIGNTAFASFAGRVVD